jgi:hypothetical protein
MENPPRVLLLFLSGALSRKLDYLRGITLMPHSSTHFLSDLCSIQAQAALIYDAVFVLVEVLNKKKKTEKNNPRRTGGSQPTNTTLDCNSNHGWTSHGWEQGNKIARSLRKVKFYPVLPDFTRFYSVPLNTDFVIAETLPNLS